MAFALVGARGAVSQGAVGAAVTPAYGQAPTANNLLILRVAATETATLPATPAGWTLIKQQAGTSCSASIYAKIAAGADAAPTVALVASTVLACQLSEWSGARTSSADQDQSGGGAGITSTLVATCGAHDSRAGELVIYASAQFYSTAATKTNSMALNNGATATDSNNNGTSSVDHYVLGDGITTGNSSADTATLTFTTTKITGAVTAVATFFLVPLAVAIGPVSQGQTPTVKDALSRAISGTQASAPTQALQVNRPPAAAQSQSATVARQVLHRTGASQPGSLAVGRPTIVRVISASQAQSLTPILAVARLGFAAAQSQSVALSHPETHPIEVDATQAAAAVVARSLATSSTIGQGQAVSSTRALFRTVSRAQGQLAAANGQQTVSIVAIQAQGATVSRSGSVAFAAGQGQPTSAATGVSRAVTSSQGRSLSATRQLGRQATASEAQTVGTGRSLGRTVGAAEVTVGSASGRQTVTLVSTQGQSGTSVVVVSRPATAAQGSATAAGRAVSRGVNMTQSCSSQAGRSSGHVMLVQAAQSPALRSALSRLVAVAQGTSDTATADRLGTAVSVSAGQGASGAVTRTLARSLASPQASAGSLGRGAGRTSQAAQATAPSFTHSLGRTTAAAGQAQATGARRGLSRVEASVQPQQGSIQAGQGRSEISTASQTTAVFERVAVARTVLLAQPQSTVATADQTGRSLVVLAAQGQQSRMVRLLGRSAASSQTLATAADEGRSSTITAAQGTSGSVLCLLELAFAASQSTAGQVSFVLHVATPGEITLGDWATTTIELGDMTVVVSVGSFATGTVLGDEASSASLGDEATAAQVGDRV